MAQFLEKCTEWPEMTLTSSRSKIPICMLHTPLRSKFSSISLYSERFLSYGPIFGKAHKWPNDLDMFKVKNTDMHVTYTSKAQIFVHFALRWAIFEFRPNFRKSTPNDQMTLTSSRSKVPTCMLHTTPRPKFSSVSLYKEPFLSYGPIFWKVHQMTPNDLDMFKVKNTKHACYNTPPRPKFSTVSLCNKPFLHYGEVHLMTPNDLDNFKVKNSNMHVTYTLEAQIPKVPWSQLAAY